MDVRKRKRGVRASRQKLESAMLQRGISTQLALAESIASQEGIENPPKDMVYKVFNEKPVSMRNLNRVAGALGVDVHNIILTSSDEQYEHILVDQNNGGDSDILEQPLDTTSEQERKSPSRNKLLAGAFVLFTVFSLAVFGAGWLEDDVESAESLQANGSKSTKIDTSLGKVLIMVESPSNARDFAKRLVSHFASSSKVTMRLSALPNISNNNPRTSAARLRGHAELVISLENGEYYDWLQLQIRLADTSSIIANFFLSKQELTENEIYIVTNAANQITRFVDGKALSREFLYSQNASALQHYFDGINTVFVANSFNAFGVPKEHFINAANLDEGFAQAFAKLCEISVRESWIGDEITKLEHSAKYCNKASERQENSEEVILAQALLYAKTGRYEEADMRLSNLLERQWLSADAHALVAELRLFLSSSEYTDDVGNLVKQAELSIKAEPKHWRAYNTLGTYYFSLGQIESAKLNFEKASKVVKQELILVNLGTMQMCTDDLQKAISTYETLIDNFDNSYFAYENLGSIYVYLGEFERALEHKQEMIRQKPEIAIHQVWAGLAEVYSLNNMRLEAIETFRRALGILEQDELLNTNTVDDAVHKAFYLYNLHLLAPQTYPLENLPIQIQPLLENKEQLGLSAKSQLAWLAGKIGDAKTMRQLIQNIASVCPVYKRLPRLKQLQ